MRGLGHFDWPPMQALIVLTDRGDGSKWFVTHDGTDHIKITNVLPAGWAAGLLRRYDALTGPWLEGKLRVRLFMRDAHVGFEIDPTEPINNNAPVIAWLSDHFALLMTIHAGELPSGGNHIGYRTEVIEP